MSKAVVVFSGGQDSTTCLGWALKYFDEVRTITFYYHQKHSIEIAQAQKIAQLLNVSNTVVDMGIFANLDDSALIDGSLNINANHAHHTNLPASFVPNRNAIFFATAHAYAQKIGFDSVITGINQTDYSGYPDCREEFVVALEHALNLGSESAIKFHYPLIHLSKAQTFELSRDLGLQDIILEHTHTCYNGDREHRHAWGYGCGECPACQLRAKGYEVFNS